MNADMPVRKEISLMRRWAANFTLFAIALLFALLVIEAGLRIGGVSYPNFYIPDPFTGMTLKPDAEGFFSLEGGAYVVINGEGQRDIPHERSKPDGIFRVAILGDSYAEAMQVELEHTFWRVLSAKLGSCERLDGKIVEVINFGVSGFGTAQELQAYRYKVRDYNPDLVLLAFLTGNDVRNNVRELELDPLRPYFVLRDGKLELDDSFREEPAYRFRESILAGILYTVINDSRLMQLANRARQILKARGVAKDQQNVANKVIAREEAGLDSMVYHEPEHPLWRKAWRVTEGLLAMLAKEVADDGRHFMVTTLSNGIQVDPDPEKRHAYMRAHDLDTLFYPDNRVMAIGDRYGFPVLNLAPALQRLAESEGVVLHGFANTQPGEGHWNEKGHRAAGEFMANFICRKLQERR